ncbi:hypothetical protein PLESTB_000638400 [Pleodorina starrii]|uniref:Uncharacterized protein n=1 Tax=Pleodorina starrii TaxID=330485 RepID=A0A9W6F1T9_9CHLO|nr:hypothetical protein PLESTM_001299900 [Pleodorina starrii]GLC52516.1 hypothetical protein PLESTB_000638400 [Pleodorina starrii]GLC71516.1 hypothetical protein PLESTF_001130500 [Pleodorina starrii]
MSFGGHPSGKKKDGLSSLSKETQDLLQGVMKDRGLSQRAVQDIASSLQRGDSAWVGHLNSGTASYQPPKSKTTSHVKVPKVGTSGGRAPAAPPLPGRFSGKKLQHEILRDTPPEREMFRGGAPAPNREAEKDRLSKVMELGSKGAREMEEKMAAMKREARERAERAKRLDVREEMIDQIVDEVRERLTFLESMRALGRAGEYEAHIRGEVAVRLKELEKLGLPTRPQQQLQQQPK